MIPHDDWRTTTRTTAVLLLVGLLFGLYHVACVVWRAVGAW